MASLQTTKTTSQAWSSVVVNDTLTIEYVWVDIETKGIQYDLHLDLAVPIPESSLANAEFLTLTWPMGGIWKIVRLSDNNQHVHCTSMRQTELNVEEVAELRERIAMAREKISALEALNSDEFPLFNWKMQLGEWRDNPHWFLRDVLPPQNIPPGPLTAQLMTGISPFQVQIEVNSLTAVDTVEQTFTADVTWEVTVPGITTIREDSVLGELMTILEFDPEMFEFTNVNSTQDVRDLYYCITPAGSVNFTDDTGLSVPVEHTTESLNHVKIIRRIVATFSEEMTVYSFPIDQQKLTLSFSTGTGVRESLRITPAPLDAGTFAISNYKLGNVFDVVYHDKIFIGEIDADGVKKMIRFEIMLERRPGYYVTNVAIPAAIITYLCFISYTTRADGTLVETGDRLQIVLTLLLTAVTFKNQVASLTPRISYFTTLDKYVFFCFIIACVVVLENALFPVVAKFFSEENNWQEKSLLWFSIGFFTLVNVVWGIFLVLFVKTRKRASKILLRVHEAIRVIATSGIPAEHREALLHEYLDSCHYQKWEIPKICSAEFGYLHVQLPEDEPQRTKNIEKRQKLHDLTRHKMEDKLDMLKGMYAKLNPTGSPPKPQITVDTGRAQPLRLSGHTAGPRKRTRGLTPYHLMP